MKMIKMILFLSSVLYSSYVFSQENYTIILDGKEVLVDAQTNQVIANRKYSTVNVNFSNNGVHYVQPKENLYRISKAYHLSINELCLLNNINENTILKVGQKLLVNSNKNDYVENLNKTSQTYHLVQKGDTLFSIAKQYGISVQLLKQLNNLNSNGIFISQRLRIQ